MSSVRTAPRFQDPKSNANRSTQYPPAEWGMVNNPQGSQAPGVHKAQPLLSSWQWVRAQIGSRPIQRTPNGDAGQSDGQLSGTLNGPYSVQNIRNGFGKGLDDFNYGPEVVHIARFFRSANNGYGGYDSVGRSANGVTGGTGDNFTVLKRPLQRYPTRGPRSVSGAMNPKSRWDDTGRLPSVFVPTSPLR